ncbi:MAG: glycosyltransferase family 4 protein [Methylotenera sp.]|nr:glycosyltransferase family 4 protein [Oligoflexia bacterium]
MRLIVTSEYRFIRSSDGLIWTDMAFPYSYWQRYLGVFQSVAVAARVRFSEEVRSDWLRVDGEGVSVLGLPDYVGPLGYLKARSKIHHLLSSALNAPVATILSIPSPIALIAEKILGKNNQSYGVEVMGDPWEVLSGSGVKHPLRIYFRHSLTRSMKRQVLQACAASFVTTESLQKRYHTNTHAVSVGVSNIDLMPGHRVNAPRTFSQMERIQMISVGSLEQLYKAPDIVLKAVAHCTLTGLDLHLTWIGSGKYLSEMIQLSQELGIQDRVSFRGQLASGDQVREKLDASDLFILASRTEGLPRALIEAMARGLPCIGSRAGGIPELLEDSDLFDCDDPRQLAEKISEVCSNSALLGEMSRRNLEKSAEFTTFNLLSKRLEFLNHLRKSTISAPK